MKECSVLYQIKSLENLIFRNFLSEKKVEKSAPTPTQIQIIEYILSHENEEIYQKDLESVLKLRRATVSGVLQTMEKNNLIKRIKNSKDTRGKKIILNDEAKEIFNKCTVKLFELEKIIKNDISNEDLEVFVKVILKMKENVDNYSKIAEENK